MLSPKTLPQSFGALRDSVHTLGIRVRNSSGTSPSFGCSSSSNNSNIFENLSGPVLNIRRTPTGSSLHKDVDDLTLGEPRACNRRHHRRRTTNRSGSKTREVQTEDMMFPATVEDLHHCDEKHCSNHHHRQSSSSTVSIKCDKSDEDEANAIERRLANGEIEATIYMEPCSPQMLVPLVDRPQEMRELLEHRSNKDWASLVRRTFGEKLYKAQCLPLWIETDRPSMPDREWLRRSKDLLMRKACGGCTDGRLWSEFCAMVGWDESEAEMEEEWTRSSSHSHSPRTRSHSHDSSPQMNAILEVEDEEDVRR
ncbi:hypothetical protein L873DRAFT_1825185 [Choiromyces venosus 120613-1]|uniref:Uncharacterized protein n=1 Tax=Choiromyces venosus 120613-1 TaxID=1336337 RepID=A0A3N4K7V6_9PEZI|nr:hypothetical protein L873DRAFT_1825185 [Choiromyces venosus 120613-1]